MTKYDIFRFCDPKATSEQIEDGLWNFAQQVLLPLAPLYDEIVLEDQPYIVDQSKADGRAMNFRLQQIDMGLRGLVIGLGTPLIMVRPRASRDFLRLSMGNYPSNKKAGVQFLEDCWSLVFSDLAEDKRCHVADTLLNVIYVLSNTEEGFDPTNNNASRQSLHIVRPAPKKWTPPNGWPGPDPSSTGATGAGKHAKKGNEPGQ